MTKINLALLCGGKSAEHEVSLNSAINIVKALNPNRYNIYLIAIDKKGYWHQLESTAILEQAAQARQLPFDRATSSVALIATDGGAQLFDIARKVGIGHIDVVFPILHGPFGEDGSIQGYLKTVDVAYVGSAVLGSAVGMDKDVMKRLLRDAGLPLGEFLVIHAHKRTQFTFEAVAKQLGTPFFVKSANMGSSIGVHKVHNSEDWETSLNDAFLYDHKVVVEAFMQGREIECSVLGLRNVRASLPGEIHSTHEFYSYEAKYLDDKGAELIVPAKLSASEIKRVQELAIQTFEVLCCEGLSRVDFFIKPNGEILINEINTLPGFTKISMYPKMWEATGLKYADLIDELVELARERHQLDSELRTTR
jgi:D-alanine-D-alanine ligase